MKIIVCTLFEHDYHLGAAVLVNSLCRSGYKGTIYAGFRGPLPPWTENRVKQVHDAEWEVSAMPDVRICFLRLETSAHFSNFKPDFLLQLEKRIHAESDAVIYCDPDIVIESDWLYIEEWLSCGVALCEDVNSPRSENHPRRAGWRRFFKPLGFDLRFRSAFYVNGGWIGLKWEHRRLLEVWQKLLARITESLGGQDIVGVEGGRLLPRNGFANCFSQPDQDALNAALEACPDLPVSILAQEAMGFNAGIPVVPHAVGPAKPWQRNYLMDAFKGLPPTLADKAFWRNAEAPLHPFSADFANYKRMELKVGAAIGRVIRRS